MNQEADMVYHWKIFLFLFSQSRLKFCSTPNQSLIQKPWHKVQDFFLQVADSAVNFLSALL